MICVSQLMRWGLLSPKPVLPPTRVWPGSFLDSSSWYGGSAGSLWRKLTFETIQRRMDPSCKGFPPTSYEATNQSVTNGFPAYVDNAPALCYKLTWRSIRGTLGFPSASGFPLPKDFNMNYWSTLKELCLNKILYSSENKLVLKDAWSRHLLPRRHWCFLPCCKCKCRRTPGLVQTTEVVTSKAARWATLTLRWHWHWSRGRETFPHHIGSRGWEFADLK